MMKRPIYIPVIKGKLNDFKAVKNLSAKTIKKIKPLVETVPISPEKNVEKQINKFVDNINKNLHNMEIFVDFYGTRSNDRFDDGENAVIKGFELLFKNNSKVTPVYGFHRDDRVWPMFKNIVTKFGQGFCFRVDIDDLDDQTEATIKMIVDRSREIELDYSEIDIFIDMRDIRDVELPYLQKIIIDFIFNLTRVGFFRSICLASSSALKTVVDIPRDGFDKVLRNELKLWMRLQSDLSDSISLVYGDYMVFHPDYSDIGSSKYANAKIRYTEGKNIYYFRGHRLFDPPNSDFPQYHELADKVRSSSIYCGPGFSHGDKYIFDCAEYKVGSGNLGTWVLVDANHHIEYCSEQIDRLISDVTKIPNQSEVDELFEVV